MSVPRLVVEPLTGYPSELGAALWMLEDARHRTLRAVDGLAATHVDATAAGSDNSIGSLLYHVAAVEVDWLFQDILEQAFPEWVEPLFPEDVRDAAGHLALVAGVSLQEHLTRLLTVRRRLLEEMAVITSEEFKRVREIESGATTPEWVLHHLGQHEAEHRGQIQALRTILENRG